MLGGVTEIVNNSLSSIKVDISNIKTAFLNGSEKIADGLRTNGITSASKSDSPTTIVSNINKIAKDQYDKGMNSAKESVNDEFTKNMFSGVGYGKLSISGIYDYYNEPSRDPTKDKEDMYFKELVIQLPGNPYYIGINPSIVLNNRGFTQKLDMSSGWGSNDYNADIPHICSYNYSYANSYGSSEQRRGYWYGFLLRNRDKFNNETGKIFYDGVHSEGLKLSTFDLSVHNNLNTSYTNIGVGESKSGRIAGMNTDKYNNIYIDAYLDDSNKLHLKAFAPDFVMWHDSHTTAVSSFSSSIVLDLTKVIITTITSGFQVCKYVHYDEYHGPYGTTPARDIWVCNI